MSDLEAAIANLEALAVQLQEQKESWSSEGGIGDRVTGIRVIRNGQVIQEWHDEHFGRNHASGAHAVPEPEAGYAAQPGLDAEPHPL